MQLYPFDVSDEARVFFRIFDGAHHRSAGVRLTDSCEDPLVRLLSQSGQRWPERAVHVLAAKVSLGPQILVQGEKTGAVDAMVTTSAGAGEWRLGLGGDDPDAVVPAYPASSGRNPPDLNARALLRTSFPSSVVFGDEILVAEGRTGVLSAVQRRQLDG